MAELEEGLYSFLTGTTAISALVGTRVYPLLIPLDATLPAVAYQRISGPFEAAHDGPTGLVRARMQITCVAAPYAAARGVAAAIVTVLLGYRGVMGSFTVSVPKIENVTDGRADALSACVSRFDAIIWYRTTA
jgi:Protein of unknown function (DUF3168)